MSSKLRSAQPYFLSLGTLLLPALLTGACGAPIEDGQLTENSSENLTEQTY